MVKEHWLHFKSPATLITNKRVSLSFEALKPGIDFSLAIKVFWHLLPVEGCFLYIENLLFMVATFMNYLT